MTRRDLYEARAATADAAHHTHHLSRPATFSGRAIGDYLWLLAMIAGGIVLSGLLSMLLFGQSVSTAL